MKVIANIALLGVLLLCIGEIVNDIYIGVFNDLMGKLFWFVILPAFPILLVFLPMMVAFFLCICSLDGLKSVRWQAIIGVGALFVTNLASSFCLPHRIAFSYVRPEFEKLVAQFPDLHHADGDPLNQQVGIYHVDEYRIDDRGGIYFRVYSCGDGIGPDRMSFGFAYMANHEGTPFGRARLQLCSIGHDWYFFSASSDWF